MCCVRAVSGCFIGSCAYVVGTCFGVEYRPDSLCISAAENGDEIVAMLKKSSDRISQPHPPQTPPPSATL